MASRSGKLYDKSPKLERDGEGKVGISKPTAADKESAGIGEPTPVEQVGAMHERHASEMKDMHKRHFKEMKKLYAGSEGDLPAPAGEIEKE